MSQISNRLAKPLRFLDIKTQFLYVSFQSCTDFVTEKVVNVKWFDVLVVGYR